MGLFSSIRWFISLIIKLTVAVFVVGFLLAVVPGLPPYDMQFTASDLPKTKEFTGPLTLNRRLDGAEHLFENQLHGPESVVYHNGALYTGLHGGEVVKIVGDKIIPVVKFGKPCAGYFEEHICGRPLGLTFDKAGALYVADAYYGIFKVNVTTKAVVQLVSPDTVIEGRKANLFNSVVVGSDGAVYWTDSDSNVKLHDGAFSILADGTGRLIKYDPVRKDNAVLVDRIKFANGVALASDESYIVVAECLKYRLLRYFLKGPKKGRHEIFVDGLPGAPDNLKVDSHGNFLVSLICTRDEQSTPTLLLNLERYPLVRKSIARALKLLEILFEKLEPICPENFCKIAVHAIGHFEYLTKVMPQSKRVTVLLVNKDGYIINSFHALDGKIGGICDVEIVGDYMYLGSPFNKYLGRVKTPKELQY